MTRRIGLFAHYRRLILVLVVIGVLFGLRSVWFEVFPMDKSFRAVDGIVDLRGTDIAAFSSLTLDGQWELYPHQLLTQQQIQEEEHASRSIQVPGNWRSTLNPDADTAYGYGTYRLRILTDPLEQPIAFGINGIQASSEVEINGKLLGGAGHVAVTASEYVPSNISYNLIYADEGATEIELLIRVANFDAPLSGGIARSVRFGSESAIDDMSSFSTRLQMVTVGIILMHSLYACIVYLYRPKDRSLFFTGLIFLCVGVAVSSGFDKTFLMWLPVNYTWTLKTRPIALLWNNLFLLLVYMKFAGIAWRGRWLKVYIAVLAGLTAVLVVAPASVVNGVMDLKIFLAIYLLSIVLFLGSRLSWHSRSRPTWM